MSIRTSPRLFTTVALGLVLTALGWPGPGAAVTIQAPLVQGTANALNPSDPVWQGSQEYQVTLDTTITATGVPQPVPSAGFRYLQVTALRDAADIYFRFRWGDRTKNASVGDTPLFADALALEIPYSANSSIAMGNQFQPVNILFWRADLADPVTGLGQPQNIVSGGAGTVQTSPDSASLPTAFSQGYDPVQKLWTVVIKRPLSGASSPNGNLPALVPGSNYRITFAQWDGAQKERNGVKLVAGSWQTLRVGN